MNNCAYTTARRATPYRHVATIGALAVLLPSSAFGGTPAGDDFNSGNLSSWTSVDPLAGPFGPTTFAADGGGYRITSVKLPPVPLTIGAGSVLSASGDDAVGFADGTTRVQVRIHNDETNALLSTRAGAPGEDGYGFYLNHHENSIGIVDMAMGGNIVNTFFPIASGTDYMLEATTIGTSITLTVWEAGTERPASPQLAIESDLYSAGITGAIVYNQPTTLGGTGGVLDATFDDFTFTPVGTALVDDFTGTLDEWTPVSLTRLDVDNSIVDGRAVISSEEVAGNLDQSILINLPSAADPEAFSNGRMRASINAQDTNVILYIRGDLGGGSAYAITFRPTDGFLILSRVDADGEVFLDTTFVPYGNGEDLMVEVSAIGSEISAKIWGAHEAVPLEPTLLAIDATYSVGSLALAVDGPAEISRPAPFHAEFGDVWFTSVDEPSNPADLNGDGFVNGSDLAMLLGAWGTSGPGDLTGDGVVNGADLAMLLGAWG